MTEMNETTLQRWMDEYGHTKRFIYLYSYMFTHENLRGEIIKPVFRDALCNFDCKYVDDLKKQYFISRTFMKKPMAEQKIIIEQYGCSPSLRKELLERTFTGKKYRELLGATDGETFIYPRNAGEC
jgi:hypothetical protein